VLTAAACFIGALPWLDAEATACLFHDDAYYYFQVARNLAAGKGPTFDGLHLTNGFHPLWLALLVPVFAIVPGDIWPLRTVACVEAGVVATAAVLLYRDLCPRLDGRSAFLVALLLVGFPATRGVLVGGMESSLLLLALVLVWRCQSAPEPGVDPPWGHWVRLGAWCSVALLSRVEAGLLLPAIVLLERRRLLDDPRRVALLGALPALAAGVYASWNRVVFGHWLPISALVKSELALEFTWPGRLGMLANLPWFGRELVLRLFGRPVAMSLPPAGWLAYGALAGAALAVLWWRRTTVIRAVRRGRLSLLLLSGPMLVITDWLLVVVLPPWYGVTVALMTAILAGLALARTRVAAAVVALTFALAIARSPIRLHNLREPGRFNSAQRVRAGLWLRSNSPAGARIGSWNAGMIGYFSDRSVVNLDGLVNDLEYFDEVIRGRRLEEYVDREGVTLLADQTCGKPPYPAGGRLPAVSVALAARIRLLTAEGYGPGRCPGFAVWEIGPSRGASKAVDP